MRDWLQYKWSQLEDWYYDVTKFVRCLDNMQIETKNGREGTGAYCKKRFGHWSKWHQTGSGRLKWKREN